jgi:hypothetical protein
MERLVHVVSMNPRRAPNVQAPSHIKATIGEVVAE